MKPTINPQALVIAVVAGALTWAAAFLIAWTLTR